MAIAHSKPDVAVSQRQYTVGYVPNGGASDPHPAIHLKGRWLEKVGFTRGTPIRVTIVGQHLVITQLPRQSLINNIMHKVEHLSPETQQALAQMIHRLLVQETPADCQAEPTAKEGVQHGQD